MQEALLLAVFLPPTLLLVTAAGALGAFLLRADPGAREPAAGRSLTQAAQPEPALARVERPGSRR